MLRYHAGLYRPVKTVGLAGCRVVVVLGRVVCELPTASLASQARVYCGYRRGPTRVMPPGGGITAPALACVLAVACCTAHVVASVAGGFVV